MIPHQRSGFFFDFVMGSILSTPVTAQHLQRKASSHLQAGFAELQGWRDDHEDAHVMETSWGGDASGRGLFVVFDGHGGTSAADFGALYLPLKMSTKKVLSDEEVTQYFLECDEAYRMSPDNQAGAAVCMVLTEKMPSGKYKVRFANAGDSRAILVSTKEDMVSELSDRALDTDLHNRKDSELTGHAEHLYGPEGLHFVSDDFECGVRLSTIDHKPNLASEKARIEAAGGFVSNDTPARLQGMLALSRMIGDFNYKKNPSLSPGEQMGSCVPEIFSAEADEGDLVILACDGIFDVLSNNELARQVRLRIKQQLDAGVASPDLAKVSSDIVNLCLNRLDSKDNMSLMVIWLRGPSVAPSAKFEDELLVGEFPRIVEQAEMNNGNERRTKKAYEDFFSKVGYFKNPNACQVCGRYFKQMSSCPCKKAIYCDQVCQKQDWKSHRKVCGAVRHSSKATSPKSGAVVAAQK
jgi:serine/threonine protein phosphatase PrpC